MPAQATSFITTLRVLGWVGAIATAFRLRGVPVMGLPATSNAMLAAVVVAQLLGASGAPASIRSMLAYWGEASPPAHVPPALFALSKVMGSVCDKRIEPPVLAKVSELPTISE